MLAILPNQWFESLPQSWLLLIVALALICVIRGSDWLVEGVAGIARRLGMSKVIIGATIVSLGTTSPEAAVSVLAAWQGDAGLALGNGVGSIIADTGLIFGLGCLLTRLPADRFVLTRQGWVQFGTAMLCCVICYGLFALWGDGAVIGRWVGVLFTSLLVCYMVLSIKWSRQHPVGEPPIEVTDQDRSVEELKSFGLLVLLTLVGLVLVIFAADGLVQSVSQLARRWGIPETVIAATMIALGTSLPELIVGLTAIRRGHPELLVGNVIGADILNMLFVIGAAALAAPLPIVEIGSARPNILLEVHLPTMLLMLILFRVYIARAVSNGSFSRWMGAPLIVMYVAFVSLSYWLSLG